MKNKSEDWRSVPYSRHGRQVVPKLPGVYAIMRVSRVMGLPLQSNVIYIGKTENLRLRMGQHLNPTTAHNPGVAAAQDKEALEFWCNLMPDDVIASAEKHLIRFANPKANKLRY